MNQRVLTDRIKSMALDLGANLVGVAPVERFANAPITASPQGIMPAARSVISMALHYPDSTVELACKSHPQDTVDSLRVIQAPQIPYRYTNKREGLQTNGR